MPRIDELSVNGLGGSMNRRNRRITSRSALLLGTFSYSLLTTPGQDRPMAAPYVSRLEKNLNRNIIPFWYPRSVDRQYGGYSVNFGPAGEPQPDGTRMIVTQARMLWYFARMARAGLAGKDYLAAADTGYRFLKDKMWDSRHGGFFWETDRTGERVLRRGKHLYGQAFGLYGVSEYALASGKRDVREFAELIFRTLEEKAHDRQYGGYVEVFNDDWTAPAAGGTTYLGDPPGIKLMNTHLHLMEAASTFYRATRLPLARERLLELIAIESNTVVRKGIGACTDKYQRDWTPILEGNLARVSYGHDIENVWLLVDACDAAGISPAPYIDLFRSLWNYALKYGYDDQQGGFYDSGPFNQPADARNKTWWVQSETLVSALYMYTLTGEHRYFSVFEKTCDWVDRHQTDWDHGEWHEIITPDGKIQGSKGHMWKAAYHNGRAMIECLALLKQMANK
jgi:mannobiose 2-epimerase